MPIVRYSEISDTIEKLAEQVEFCETTYNDG